jgi:hypothetical protein
VAHRTSPTNIGMGLLATLAAHDLGLLPVDDLVERLERTLDRRGPRAPRGAPAQLVRHAESRAAAAALRLDGRQRQPRRSAARSGGGMPSGERRGAGLAPGPGGAAGGDRAAARRARPTGCASPFSSIRGVSSSRSAFAWRMPADRGEWTPPTTTCSPRSRASPASSPSPRATCRRATGSTSAGSSSASRASRRSSPGARRCSST